MRVQQFLPVSGDLTVALHFENKETLELAVILDPRVADERILKTSIRGFHKVVAIDMLQRSEGGSLSPMSQNTATRGVVKATGYGAKAFIAVADAERGIALVEAGAGAPAKRDREPRVTDLWSLQSLARNPAVKAFAAAQGHTGKLSVKPLEIYLSTGFVDPQLVTLVVKLAISSPGNRKPSEGSFSCFVSAVPGAAPHATPLEAGVRQRQGWFYPPSAKLKS